MSPGVGQLVETLCSLQCYQSEQGEAFLMARHLTQPGREQLPVHRTTESY
jgi:hypothetical protein